MDSDMHRRATVERTAAGRYVARNVRGGEIGFGAGDSSDFTPIELLLAAIAGCSAIDVDLLTSRRAEPEAFAVDLDAEKIRDEHGNRLDELVLSFRITFPVGDAGDAARELLPKAVRLSHDRLCTVGRTVEVATPIATRIGP
jgi:putative redox protein